MQWLRHAGISQAEFSEETAEYCHFLERAQRLRPVVQCYTNVGAKTAHDIVFGFRTKVEF
jgi:hypothetical protein